jgi:hypothetical protein
LGTEATILGARDYLVKGAINNTGLIKAINNTIHRYSLKMTCEDLSLYLQSSLNPLRQIMGYGYNANIPPDFSMLFRSVKTKIKELRFSTLFSLFFMNKKDNQLVLVAYNYPEWGDTF